MVLGDLVLDIILQHAAPEVPGSDTPGTVRFRAGGSAANTARELAALGGRVTFLGAVGADETGVRLDAVLRRAGVTARTVVHPAAPTARVAVRLGPGGERSFITERGAADLLEPGDLDPRWFGSVSALHLPLYSLLAQPLASAARRAVELLRARHRPALISVDLASVGPIRTVGVSVVTRLLEELGPGLLMCNAAEAALVGGRGGPAGLLRCAPIVVVKQGARGCEVMRRPSGPRDGDPPERVLGSAVATRPLTVSDTTGAGDAFDAGFLLALLPLVVAGRTPGAADLRRAAVAGNRAAGRLLASSRQTLDL